MLLPPAARRLLACPKCKGGLEIDEPHEQIRCAACRLAFPIVREIPMLLLSQAKPS